MSSWDAELYLRFANERTQPSIDLAARIAVPHPSRIADLGCGPGNSTEILKRKWPAAVVVGVDNSPEMIAAASKSYPEGEWVMADLATWKAQTPFDVVFANAALHWVPDHARLLPHLFAQLAPGGALAVQIPAHDRSVLHRQIRAVAEDPEWDHLLEAPRRAMPRHSPSFYYDVLQPLASRVEIWETKYHHIMENHSGLLEWFRGTGLRPYLKALESDFQRERFEAMLLERFVRLYPQQKDGRVLFPFPRIFFIAYR